MAILVFWKNETAAMLVFQTNPVRVELFSQVNNFFCSHKFAQMLATRVKTLYVPFLTEKMALLHTFHWQMAVFLSHIYLVYNLLKITASCQTNMSLTIISNVTKSKNELWRTVSGLQLESCFNLLQVCPSVSPFVFVVLSNSQVFMFSDVLSRLFYVSLSLVMVPTVLILMTLVSQLP